MCCGCRPPLLSVCQARRDAEGPRQVGRWVGKWKGEGFPILVPLHHELLRF